MPVATADSWLIIGSGAAAKLHLGRCWLGPRFLGFPAAGYDSGLTALGSTSTFSVELVGGESGAPALGRTAPEDPSAGSVGGVGVRGSVPDAEGGASASPGRAGFFHIVPERSGEASEPPVVEV